MRLGYLKSMVMIGLVATAACSDGTGPGTDQEQFNARKVQDGLAAIERVSANPVLNSFRGLSGQIPSAASGNGSSSARLVGVVRDLAGLVTGPVGGPSFVPVIRTSVLGKTMVYDAATKQYVVATGRQGAPANGVRFVLYEEVGGMPNPAKEIGYADLTDEKAGSATSVGLRFKVVAGQVTHLDYSFDLTGSLAAASVKVVGFLSDGTERVNFDLATSGQFFGRGGLATIEGKIEVPSQQFSIAAKVTGTAGEENGPGTIDVAVKSGSDTLTVVARSTATTLEATIKVNGKLFAAVSGTPANPVITGEGGRALTTEEYQALAAVIEFSEGIFKLIEGLLAPAVALLLLGLGL